MTRLTYKKDDTYSVDETAVRYENGAYTGIAIDRLASFENIYDNLTMEQEKISSELEALRAQGREHSVKFKQLFARKLQNNNFLIIFDIYII
jgi:hypothetical protein